MAWKESGLSLQMAEGDYGVPLTIEFEGITFTARDQIDFVICRGEVELITKTFSDISNNTVELVISREETERLPVGRYLYRIDWYQDYAFMDNLAPNGLLIVIDKAGGAAT